MDSINNDWKKQASAVLKEKEAELAFMKLATRSIEDKAAALLQAPYYLGFELVFSTKSHDKMIGIFAFRIGKQLLYAPVFYINGGVKGTDLLYLQNDKKFVLLDPDWCDYLISKYQLAQGSAIDDAEASKATQSMDLRWIAYPPYMSKGASEKCVPLGETFSFHNEKAESLEQDEQLAFETFKTASEDKKPLKRFIEKEGYKAFEKIACAVHDDFEFANNVVSLLDQDEWCPEEFLKQASVKTASIKKSDVNSVEQKNCIAVIRGKFNPHTKCAAEQIEKGITIDDRRDQGNLDVVYAANEENFKSLDSSKAGVYEILGADGTIKKFVSFCGKSDAGAEPAILLDPSDNSVLHYYDISDINSKDADESIGAPHTEGYDQALYRKIMARELDEDWKQYVVKDPTVSNDKAYAIYLIPNGYNKYISDECFLVKGKKEKDGIKYYDVVPFNGYRSITTIRNDSAQTNMTIKVNPDAPKSDIEARVFRESDVFFIPVALQDIKDPNTTLDQEDEVGTLSTSPIIKLVKISDFVPGDIEDYDLGLAYNQKIDKSKVDSLDGDRYLLKITGDTEYDDYNKVASTVKLMHDLNISKESAEDILKRAAVKGSFSFYHKKIAAKLTLRPEPDFYESTDSDLGVPIFNDGERIVTTEEVTDTVPNPRYGDHAKFIVDGNNVANDDMISNDVINEPSEETNSMLLTATPNMLAQIAEKSGNKNIFEHGIIGTYAKSIDASAYISEFIPDLKEGLDKLGRLYFLILWKPQSFLKYYGSDDLMELESKLLSSFKQMGELVLELLLKTKDSQINTTTATAD